MTSRVQKVFLFFLFFFNIRYWEEMSALTLCNQESKCVMPLANLQAISPAGAQIFSDLILIRILNLRQNLCSNWIPAAPDTGAAGIRARCCLIVSCSAAPCIMERNKPDGIKWRVQVVFLSYRKQDATNTSIIWGSERGRGWRGGGAALRMREG